MSISVFQFEEYRLDVLRFGLSRAGQALKLERKPMELLILLASSRGNLVTREEIASQLWDREVFVDTEHGINTAIRKIRSVLRDDPEQPRFLQTVTGKGYRFIAPLVEVPELLQAEAPSTQIQLNAPEDPSIGAGALPGRAPPTDFARARAEEAASDRDLLPAVHPPLHAVRGFRAALPRPTVVTAGLGILVLIGLTARRFEQQVKAAKNISSIAVLPFENFSHDAGQDYLADGVTDELITQLAKHSMLRVVSRTSVMQFKRTHMALPEVAKALKVDSILEGSIARSGSDVHLNLQLIEVSTDRHVWAETYDRNANDLATMPQDAALAIAERLHSTAEHAGAERPVLPAAHDAYLRGRDLWFNHPEDAACLEYFRRAIELQPDYAMGWVGLSMYYGAGAVIGQLPRQESLPQALKAARKAVELDESSPQAHLVLGGSIFFGQADAAKADYEFSRALALDPQNAEAHHLRAKMLAALNRHEEAIREQKIATEIDPFARRWALALSYLLARQFDQVARECQLRLEQFPNDPSLMSFLALAYHWLGRDQEAAELNARVALLGDGGPAEAAAIRAAFARGGYGALVERDLAADIQQRKAGYLPPVRLARAYAALGRKPEALASLEAAFEERSPMLLWMQCYPEFDFLHAEPRYRAIVQGMNLPMAS